MTLRRSRTMGAAMGMVCLALAGCDTEAPAPAVDVTAELATINLAPATLEDAETQFARLDALSKQSGHDPRVMAATRQLADNIEPLNGLVDKINVGEGHSVSFYAKDGSVSIAEAAPRGTAGKVPALLDKHLSVAEVFKALAPSREMPAALLKPGRPSSGASAADNVVAPGPEIIPGAAPAGTIDGITTVQSALTAADGPWYVDNICPKTGSQKWCQPNWGNGGTADSGPTTKYTTSTLQIAPFSGDAFNIRRIRNGVLLNTLTVFPGNVYTYSQHGWTDEDCDFWGACDHFYVKVRHKWEIINAAQDGFHWSGNMFNETLPPGR